MNLSQLLEHVITSPLDSIGYLDRLRDEVTPSLMPIAMLLAKDDADDLIGEVLSLVLHAPLRFYPPDPLPEMVACMVEKVAVRSVCVAFASHRIGNRTDFFRYLFGGEVPEDFEARLQHGRYRRCLADILSCPAWHFSKCQTADEYVAMAHQLLRPQLRLLVAA